MAARGAAARWPWTCGALGRRSGGRNGRPSARRSRTGAGPKTRVSRSRGHRIACGDREPLDCVREWFGRHGWTPFPFQEQVWRAYLAGESGLVHAATGTGKTYAAWLGPVLEWMRDYPVRPRRKAEAPPPLRVLWITPLRALAGDTEAALRAPVEDFGLPWTVESRTGDTSARVRARQRERLPTALVTTPESLSLLLTRDDADKLFDHLELVVVDEWHELLASKRGVQTELGLARLRRIRPELRTLGLSATLGNLDVARDALLGADASGTPRPGRIMQGLVPKALQVDALIPETMERFPWSGQIGLRLLPEVVRAIEEGESALVFTNTRATAEIWYQALLAARPDWAGHHGPASRLAGSRRAGVGRGRAPRWQAALRGLHLDPRSRRGLHARWTGCCRWEVPRRSGGSSSGPGGAATSPERSAASPACLPTRSSWWTWPPRATPSKPAASRRGGPWSGRSTCSPSTR